MTLGQQQYYLFASPVFFDTPARWHEGAARFAVADLAPPPGWRREERDIWITLLPDGPALPPQGWKIHVSGRSETADQVCRIVWDHCIAAGVGFKFLCHGNVLLALSSKYSPRSGSGKLLTVYPRDEAQLRDTLAALDRLLGGESGPYLLSDLRYAEGPLYVRYGGFVQRHCATADGDLALAIEGPDGGLVPDVRRPVFTPPSWVPLPAFLQEHRAARASSGADVPYRVRRALHFSNGGGVYVGEDGDGGPVILKEARPLAGLDREGRDAIARLRREQWALKRLAGTPGVPRLVDYFSAGGHEFLVEEYVDALPLYQWQGVHYPLVSSDAPTPAELADYAKLALDLHARLADVIAAVRDRGVIFGDLHPGNVLVRSDGSPVLVDFELAYGENEESHPGLRAAGFSGGSRVPPADRDRYGLAAVALWLFLPLSRLLSLAPAKLDEYRQDIADHFPLPDGYLDGWVRTVRAGLDEPPAELAETPRVRPDDRDVNWASACSSMAASILASAEPDRTDRRFPGDIAQFSRDAVGLMHGAAGVLWVLSVTGYGRYPEHEEWLCRTALTAPTRPGFYEGAHGLAYVADHFGLSELAGRLLERARSRDREVTAVDLQTGLAGAALNLLHFAGRTGDSGLRDEAIALGQRIADALRNRVSGSGRPGPGSAGLLRGWSGPALLFVRLYQATGDAGYLDLAVVALHRDLEGCTPTGDGRLQVLEPGVRTLGYLHTGSAGIALVIDELLDHCPDERLVTSLPPLVRGCISEFTVQSGLFHGRAGLVATLSRVGARLSTDHRPVLAGQLRGLGRHAIGYHRELAFPGNQLMRLSTDLATGTAGVLLAVHATTAWHPAFLPFFTARQAWCGRGYPSDLG